MALDLNTATKSDCIAEAHRWLDKAIEQEAAGKGDGFVTKVFQKAVDYENAAFDGRS